MYAHKYNIYDLVKLGLPIAVGLYSCYGYFRVPLAKSRSYPIAYFLHVTKRLKNFKRSVLQIYFRFAVVSVYDHG